MSDSPQRPWDRRRFLQAALAVTGGIVTLGPQRSWGFEPRDLAHWAFLSDTHIAADPDNKYRGFCPYQNLQEVTGQLAGCQHDGLVVTGDLARLKGHAGDYTNLQALLTPIAAARPIHLVTGNHDHRVNFLNTFTHANHPTWDIKGKHMITARTDPVMLIVLDSLLFVDMPWGRLGRSQCAWLQTYLRVCDDLPTILMLHHPIAGKDALLDARRFLDLVKPIAKIKAIVHGHSHRFGFHQYEGIHVISLPATGYNMRNDEPVGWVEAHLTGTGGDFTLHALEGNTRLDGSTTHLRWRT